MTNTQRGIDSWTDEQWLAVRDAVQQTLDRTAKNRQVVEEAQEQLGAEAIVVQPVNPGPPMTLGPRGVSSAIHMYVDVALDDTSAADDQVALRLVESAAAQLGRLEEQEVVQGAPLAAPPVPLPAGPARVQVTAATVRAQLNVVVGGRSTAINAAGKGGRPTAGEISAAINAAVAALNRPGHLGLFLNDELVSILRQPPVAGGDPEIRAVEEFGGGVKVVDTTQLPGAPYNAGGVCGILFCLEPAAVDVVWSRRPAVTPLGRAGGLNNLRLESQLVPRILDQAAVFHIVY